MAASMSFRSASASPAVAAALKDPVEKTTCVFLDLILTTSLATSPKNPSRKARLHRGERRRLDLRRSSALVLGVGSMPP